MKNASKLWIFAVAVIIFAGTGCGTDNSGEGEAVTDSPAIAGSNNTEYLLKHEWPEKPKIGSYTLKVNLADKAGAPVNGAEVVVSYDMPSMRGHHATTETMKQNAAGDYLLPINFVMGGDWEIIISARKDGSEIAAETILLDI